MANQNYQANTKEPYKYPSRFGSHSSMIDEAETAKLNDSTLVTLKDEFGLFTTYRNRLDNRMADPNRYAGKAKPDSQKVEERVGRHKEIVLGVEDKK